MIAIIDFGSQTTHLIARRLKEQGIPAEILSPSAASLAQINALGPSGIILSGSHESVYCAEAPTVGSFLFDSGIPVLGICYGWQLMAHLLGGRVEAGTAEFGMESVTFSENIFLLPETEFPVVMSHGDSVVLLPEGFIPLASSGRVAYAAAGHKKKRLYGLQFHPEASHSYFGTDILLHFAESICSLKHTEGGCVHNVQAMAATIADQVGDGEVIVALSGGVDSSVLAKLLERAIGSQLHAVYIESGLMRSNTCKLVQEFGLEGGVAIVHAEERFLSALFGISDPEEKRKVCGRLYIELFEEIALKRWPKARYLAQGTIYSDWVESNGAETATCIKSHHNVGGLPKKMPFELIEPLRYLYKDEVRSLGRTLGLSEDIVGQHPFPGPGYAVRIVGEVTKERLEQVRQADQIIVEEIEKAGLTLEVFQCFAIMTGAYSTAVVGDQRAFAEVVALRAYTSKDVMTAEVAQLPYPLLAKIVRRLVGEVPRISRIVYDITPKPPATMEWL